MILGKLLVLETMIVNYIACDSSPYIYVSTNALVWKRITPSGVGGSSVYCAFCYGGVWAIGTDGGMYSSIDGYNWSNVTNPLNTIYSIAFDGANFIIAGTGSSYDIAESSSLLGSYTGVAYPFTNYATWVCGGGGNACATGSGGSTQAYRNSVWYGLSSMFDSMGYCVVWHGSKFVAVGEGSVNSIAYSNDAGNVWTGEGLTVFDYAGYAIASNGSTIVAGGAGSTLNFAYSTDGIAWTPKSGVFWNYVTAIFWDGSRFIAVDAGAQIATSTDGVNWNSGTYSISGAGTIRSLYSNTI